MMENINSIYKWFMNGKPKDDPVTKILNQRLGVECLCRLLSGFRINTDGLSYKAGTFVRRVNYKNNSNLWVAEVKNGDFER